MLSIGEIAVDRLKAALLPSCPAALLPSLPCRHLRYTGLIASSTTFRPPDYFMAASSKQVEHHSVARLAGRFGKADLAREGRELREDPRGAAGQLAKIYMKHGLDETLARQVASQLMAQDALSP